MNLDLDRSTWPRVRFGAIVAASKATVDPTDGSVERYVAGEHMETDDLQIRGWGAVGDGYLGPAFHRKFVAGQVLYGSRRTYLRKVAVAEFDGVTANTTFVLETRDNSTLLQDFLPWIMSAESFHAFAIQESKGSVNPYINFSDLARFEFALPPLAEQQRLDELLWAAEHHRRALRQTLEATAEVERVLLRTWIGQSERRHPLKALVAGQVGGLWGVARGENTNDIKVLRGTDIDEFGVPHLSSAPTRSVSDRELSSRVLSAGDIVLEKSGGSPTQPVGKVGLVLDDTEPSICSNFCVRIQTNTSVVMSEYLFLILRGLWLTGGFASVTGKTTNISNLRISELMNIEVAVPDETEQRRRVAEWQRVTRSRETSTESLDQSRRVSNAILEEVFG
ncbi:restriction endonuclease subunit S [Microbacterium sp. ProA8]|uniref:restriction endonuclease subunit S n=1 Tax=Microbacterium chionoecetis TaxID=3153754 RepID=UPI00326767CD